MKTYKMKTFNLIVAFLALGIILSGCARQVLESEELADGSVADSFEEEEISSGLEDLEDLESLEEDLGEDLGLEELEELEY